MLNFRKVLRVITAFTMTVCFLLTAVSVCTAESTANAIRWVLAHNPDETVLLMNEDGSGLYFETQVRWSDNGSALLLESDDGQAFELKYEANEEYIIVYLPSMFSRISEIGEDGSIIGTWKASGTSQSSFVFTEDGKFLEDATFTGSYGFDPQSGTVLLSYIGGFEDTMIYVSFYEGNLIVEYPWKLILAK